MANYFPLIVDTVTARIEELPAGAGLDLSSSNIANANVITAVGNITTTANISGNYILGNGSLLSGIDASGIQSGNSNVRVVSPNGNVSISVAGTSNVAVFASTGEYITGILSVSGNANVAGILTDNYYYANGSPLDFQQPSGANTAIQFNDNDSFGGSAAFTFDKTSNTVQIGNALSVVGNANVGNLGTAGLITATGNITGGNLVTSGVLSVTGNANVGNLNATYIAGTLTTASQPNITSVGSLGSLTVTGNITGGNISVTSVSGTLTTASQTNITAVGTLTSLTVTANVTGGNLVTGGVLSVTGNANVGNLGTAGAITATSNITGGNVTTVGTANIGTLAVTGTSSHTGNATFGNISASGVATVTGNITGGNLITAGLASVGTTLGVTGNANVGNLGTAGLITATGNITGGNIGTGGLVLATGNITGGNVTTSGLANVGTLSVTGTSNQIGNAAFGNISGTGSASFTGNVSGGNVNTNNIVGTAVTITSTGVLNLAPTGNITANSKNINNLADPASAQDAATKSYVDSVAQGLDTKASVVAATIANITLSGTQTIDGVAVIAGERVLVKNQTLSQNNGIYLCAAGAWTRTTDMDTWSEVPGSYVFVEGGTTQADTGWVCTSDAGGTLGTTPIVWVQFSGAGSYTAGTGLTLTGTAFSVNASQTQITSVGTLGTLSVTGNASVGNLNSTNISGTLTTASQTNITAVGTLTSLAVTGNISGGNLTSLGSIGTTGNISGSAISGNTLTLQGNAAVGNISVSDSLFSSSISSASNIAVTGTNVNIYATGTINLNSAVNITANSKNINNVADPVQAQDAATKTYVDTAYTAGSGLGLANRVFSANTDGVTTSIISGNIVVPAGAVFTTPNIGAATGISLTTTGNVTASVLKTANISIDLDSLDATANLNITAALGKTISMFTGDGSEVDLTSAGVAIKTVTGATTYSWAFGTSGNLTLPTGGSLTTTGNISVGNMVASGNVTGNYILGNGSQLTGIITSVSNLQNGNSNVSINSAGGNVQIAVNGIADDVVIAPGRVDIIGAVNINGPVATAKTITANSIVADGINALLISPVTIGNGVSVTVPATSTLYIFTPA